MEKAIREAEEGILMDVTVSPNAKRNEVAGYNEWRGSIEVKVKAPPRDGKANAELVRFLSKLFGVEVEIVKGKTSNQKTVLVKGMEKEKVIEILRNVSKQRK